MVDFGIRGRESERLFRCIAGDLGECNRLLHSLRKRLDRHVFPLLPRECTEKQGDVGKLRDRCDYQWKDQDVLLMLTCTLSLPLPIVLLLHSEEQEYE